MCIHVQWITLLNTMLKEAEWARNKLVPTMYEYMTNGYVSFALGPVVLIPLYFMGSKLSEEVVQSQEYNNLFLHISMIGRLINDRQTVKVRIISSCIDFYSSTFLS